MRKTSPVLILIFAALFAGGCATQTKEEPKDEKAAEVKPLVPKAAPAKSDDTYSVARGDHLWGISSKPAIYGNPYQWPLIYKANRDKIKDADLITPGQVFNINRNASKGDADAAVKHAKTRGEWKLGVTEESDKAYLAR
jgi:hypothetical protein